jgi:hypothetical protein
VEPFPAPDFITTEPIIGWRCWYLDLRRDPPVLRPTYFTDDFVWPSRIRFTASCTAFHPVAHAVPKNACCCGIYAYEWELQAKKQAAHFLPSFKGRLAVYGQVSLWGRVLDWTAGWRGQHAYPYMVRIPEEPRMPLPLPPSADGSDREWYRRLETYDPMAIVAQLTTLYGVEVEVERG